jgi:hypothetical protein
MIRTVNEIGKVDHLMIDKISGQVRYAIMSFGGFLGLSLTYDKGRSPTLVASNMTVQSSPDYPSVYRETVHQSTGW